MVIVTPKRLDRAAAKYKDAATELASWEAIASAGRWRSFPEVRETFPDADAVDGYVVFNIPHNRYRLITVIPYAKDLADRQTQGHIYIRSVLTHKEYDNRASWDKEYRQ
jgi:mRNA interferase HigB